jgi:2-amino-4-hydroxy-6-hydroxymethyldihydropteridine diphosphokinase
VVGKGQSQGVHITVILVGLGANLPHPVYGLPAATLAAALDHFGGENLTVVAVSRFFESAPVPASDQPWFVNAVARIETTHSPTATLAALHRIEAAFGRVRHRRWEARVLDLDLLDYDGLCQAGSEAGDEPTLPHPRLADRAFVLHPLADLDPDWVHPRSGRPLAALLAGLDPNQNVHPLLQSPPIP